jgi:ribonuclease G
VSGVAKEILVSICPGETRVAVVDDGRLVEFSLERGGVQRQVGNIYRGRVENVLPGMQAAFVNIGMEKNAFLYVDDLQGIRSPHLEEEHIKSTNLSIQDLVKEGQDLIVQIVKEPIGTKGARVITHLTLPGRFLVLMPTVDYVGISRRIEDEQERERLKCITEAIRPPGMGIIVRTAAEGLEEEELRADAELLMNIWYKIQKKAKKGPVPSVLYRDHDLLYRVLRDFFTHEIDRLIIDDSGAYDRTLELLKSLAPSLKGRVKPYTGELPLFEQYGVEQQVGEALKRRIWLENGAYLVFDQTEALTVIDVNTGKFIGSTNLNETVCLTNRVAAKEIARQIRLRNLAGIIIIDFIDMESEEDRKNVLETFEAELEKDKIKANVLGFTALGLLEITRKKVRPSLQEQLQQICGECDGTRYVDSLETIALKTERKILNLVKNISEEAIILAINPQLASVLIGPGGAHLQTLEEYTGKTIYIKGQEGLELTQIQLLRTGNQIALEREALPVVEGEIYEVDVTESHINNPSDGIGRIEGYVVDIEGAGDYVGQKVRIQITKAFRTYAKAKALSVINSTG